MSLNIEELYIKYYKQCFLFAKSYVHDDMVAEDIVSESLMKLWEISKIQEVGDPLAMLFVVLKNRSLDILKHESVRQRLLLSMTDRGFRELEIRISTLEASDPERIFVKDIQKIVSGTISSFSKQTKDIFIMSRYQNRSKKEIAEITGISIKGVEYHMAKALNKLRETLKDYLPFLLLFANLTFTN